MGHGDVVFGVAKFEHGVALLSDRYYNIILLKYFYYYIHGMLLTKMVT